LDKAFIKILHGKNCVRWANFLQCICAKNYESW